MTTWTSWDNAFITGAKTLDTRYPDWLKTESYDNTASKVAIAAFAVIFSLAAIIPLTIVKSLVSIRDWATRATAYPAEAAKHLRPMDLPKSTVVKTQEEIIAFAEEHHNQIVRTTIEVVTTPSELGLAIRQRKPQLDDSELQKIVDDLYDAAAKAAEGEIAITAAGRLAAQASYKAKEKIVTNTTII